MAVQCCSTDFAAHRAKIIEDCAEPAMQWLQCGGAIEVWGWRKIKVRRGGKAMRWSPRIERILEDDFQSR